MSDSEIDRLDPVLLSRWNRSVPRYTSYPTAPQFGEMDSSFLIEQLLLFDKTDKPLSLYFHIPFCKSMCLFCGCSVVLNRSPERQNRYLQSLLREIEQVASFFVAKRVVTQLHLGGGTPTSLTIQEFNQLMSKIREHFLLEDAEISIEVDPRTVYLDQGEKLKVLKGLGFNRISFGVQDLDPIVQEAVKRRQSEEMTVSTFYMAKELGFEGINIDLIYGLPFQTRKTFAKTISRLTSLRPDRIALYSYAKIPWLKLHQKAISEETLPSEMEKIGIYIDARAELMRGGYLPIGMDHFTLLSDSLASAYHSKTLTRNFQGYAVAKAEDMLGFGITAIGFFNQTLFQNTKEIELYHTLLANGQLPTSKGFILSQEDRLRRWVIQSLMCHFEVDKRQFLKIFDSDFDLHFADERKDLDLFVKEGFIENKTQTLYATPLGRLFIRLIASVFDAYLEKGRYSRVV